MACSLRSFLLSFVSKSQSTSGMGKGGDCANTGIKVHESQHGNIGGATRFPA
jgi:hypothetical protein